MEAFSIFFGVKASKQLLLNYSLHAQRTGRSPTTGVHKSFLNKVTHSRELHSLLLAMVLLTSLVLWQVSLRTEIKVEYSLWYKPSLVSCTKSLAQIQPKDDPWFEYTFVQAVLPMSLHKEKANWTSFRWY